MKNYRLMFRPSPYGDVDVKAWERLQDDYDTSALLKLVEYVDVLRGRFKGELIIRDEILCLHAMALTVLQGNPVTVPTDDTTIWEAANQLCDELAEITLLLQNAIEVIKPLTTLQPEYNDIGDRD